MNSVEFTSEAVRAARFREKLKGYHPEDVDAFLERAATALDQLSARLGEVTARALKAETALAENSEADESVRKTLVLAQRTAEMAVNEAKEEARQIRDEAAAAAEQARSEAASDAEAVRAAATADAEATRAEAERARAEAIEAAEAVRKETQEHIRAQDEEAHAAREQLRAETVREAEEAVQALTEEQDRLRKAVADLGDYLAAERERVLAVLHDAVDHFGQALVPTASPVTELDAVLDRDELAKTSPDPAAEDSWNFDPTVLEQPENQWWSDAEPSAPTPTVVTSTAPTPDAATAADAAIDESTPPPAEAGAEPASEGGRAEAETQEPPVAPSDGSWAAPIASHEPLPEWFTAAVPGAGEPAAAAETGEQPAPGEEGSAENRAEGHSEGRADAETNDAETNGAETNDAEPADAGAADGEADGEGGAEAEAETAEAHEDGSEDDDEPPSLLLFTLEDEGRHPDSEDLPYAISGKARKNLLGRRRD